MTRKPWAFAAIRVCSMRRRPPAFISLRFTPSQRPATFLRAGPACQSATSTSSPACRVSAPTCFADAAIPREDVEAFDRALTEAGVEHEVEIYDGAPHSFFDRKQEEFAEASDDAWARTLAFIERYSP